MPVNASTEDELGHSSTNTSFPIVEASQVVGQRAGGRGKGMIHFIFY